MRGQGHRTGFFDTLLLRHRALLLVAAARQAQLGRYLLADADVIAINIAECCVGLVIKRLSVGSLSGGYCLDG